MENNNEINSSPQIRNGIRYEDDRSTGLLGVFIFFIIMFIIMLVIAHFQG